MKWVFTFIFWVKYNFIFIDGQSSSLSSLKSWSKRHAVSITLCAKSKPKPLVKENKRKKPLPWLLYKRVRLKFSPLDPNTPNCFFVDSNSKSLLSLSLVPSDLLPCADIRSCRSALIWSREGKGEDGESDISGKQDTESLHGSRRPWRL